MNPGEEAIIQGNEVFAIEVRGFDHIPESERNMALRQIAHLWVGNSVNLFAFALGALAVSQGLSLWLALLAGLLGNLPYAWMAYGSVLAARAGLPVSTLSRAAFGIRGNLANALLSWVAAVAFEVINTVFGVEALLALFDVCGWHHSGGAGKLAAVLLQLLLCGAIAVLGHATMLWFEKLFAPVIGIALLSVTAVIAAKVDWTHGNASHGGLTSATIVGTVMTAAAVIASNPLSFLFNGPDWVRYLPSATPAASIFKNVFWSSFLPSLAVVAMGAVCATLGDMSDPVAGMKPFIPAWLFVIYIFAVVGGSLANSIPTYYSSGLSLQALGLKLHRYTATLVDLVVATGLTLYIVFVQDFSAALNDFIALLIVWVGPFGGVWIADGYLRRGRYDSRAIHGEQRRAGGYWGWHGFNVAGCIALLSGMAAAAMTMKSPLYEGPIALAMGGTDLSWVVGFPVSMLSYWGLTRRRVRLGAVSAPQSGEHP
jgi:purine-cytosine permease-like protein